MKKDDLCMQQALRQAEYAESEDEVPVGAIVVYEGRVIAKSCNQVEKLNDPTAHAEMIAITQAANYLGSKWLKGCSLYVTVEPCSMCAGALVLARIDQVIFGAVDSKTGALGSKTDVNKLKLNHKVKVKQGVLERDCASILQNFFKKKRKRDKNKNYFFNKKLTN